MKWSEDLEAKICLVGLLALSSCSSPDRQPKARTSSPVSTAPVREDWAAWEQQIADAPSQRNGDWFYVRALSGHHPDLAQARSSALREALAEAARYRASQVRSLTEVEMSQRGEVESQRFLYSAQVIASVPFANYAEEVLASGGSEQDGWRVALEVRLAWEQVRPLLYLQELERAGADPAELEGFLERAELRQDHPACEAALARLIAQDPSEPWVDRWAELARRQGGVPAALAVYRSQRGRLSPEDYAARVDELERALPGARPQAELSELTKLYDRAAYARLDADALAGLLEAAESVWSQTLCQQLQRIGVHRFAAGGAQHWIAVYRHAASGVEFVLVPGRRAEPALDPFLISRTELFQAAWETSGSPAPSEARWRAPQHPVQSVSWPEAAAFCRAAGFDLPTEAQWEHAARAGVDGEFAFGAELPPQAANLSSELEAVDQRAWNAFGLYAVHGNVREWCQDAYLEAPGADSYARDGRAEARGGDEALRAVRGGGLAGSPTRAGLESRQGVPADGRRRSLGFRPIVRLR